MPMKCKNCGFESQSGLKFCGMCGARLAQVCANCGFENPLEYRFCCMCGTPLSETSGNGKKPLSSAGPVESSPNPVPGSLEPETLTTPSIEGERRIATVIMADVQDSTRMMEQLGAETWVEVMNQVFQILEAEIYRFGGEVEQFRGDGLVAFFGARTADEDDPEHAIMASLSMQRSIKVLAANLVENKGIDLKLRVGINTGEVILTSVGDSRQYKEDTAMGEAITIAARMEAAADPGTILASEATYQLAKNKFKWQPLGETTLKGVSKPLGVYRPLDIIESERVYDTQAYGAPTLFTGRSVEISTLKDCVHNLLEGRGSIVTITGDKGMGKTSVVNQVRQHFARQGKLISSVQDGRFADPHKNSPDPAGPLIWLNGRCRSYDKSWPYSMWLDVFQNWLGIRLDEGPEEARARLQLHVENLWGAQKDSYYPYLATFLSLPLEEPYAERFRHLDAQNLKAQVFTAVKSWLDVLTARFPVIVSFSDIHWADDTSVDLLKHCLPLSDASPILWITVFRAERTSAAWEFRHHVETDYPHRLVAFDLAPLTAAESHDLIEQLIGVQALTPETETLVINKSEGNPYFIHELIHALIIQEVLVQDPLSGKWKETRQIGSLDLPDSLQGLLLSRIDLLSIEDRRVLQMATVIGLHFWHNPLLALVGNEVQLRKSLTVLQRAQLISERNRVLDLGMEYTFNSSLIRDITYESILSSQRAAIHLQIANYFENHVSIENQKLHYGSLAYHYHCAGDLNKELFYCLGAAERAQHFYANKEAVDRYTQALEILDQLEKEASDEQKKYAVDTMRFEVLSSRSRMFYFSGDVAAGRADAYALLPLSRRLSDDPTWMIDALLAQPAVNGIDERDELEDGLKMVEEARNLSRSIGDSSRELRSLIYKNELLSITNNPAWKEVGSEALALARQIGDLHAEINILLAIGSTYGMDNVSLSMAYLQEALDLCVKLDDKDTEIRLLSAIGAQYERNGDYYHLLVEFEQKRLKISREIGNSLAEGNALMFCGQIQGSYLGDYEGGLDLCKEALKNWGGLSGKLFALLRVAQMLGIQGKFDEALEILEQARSDVERNIYDLGRVGFGLVSSIIYNGLGDDGHLKMVLELTSKIRQMVASNQVSRQYHMAAACEATAAHLKLGENTSDENERQSHYRQALEISQTALALYQEFGFVQVVECASEEILYRHSLALAANGHKESANEYLEKAYTETMRKHALIPEESPFSRTFLDNILLHKEILIQHSALNAAPS